MQRGGEAKGTGNLGGGSIQTGGKIIKSEQRDGRAAQIKESCGEVCWRGKPKKKKKLEVGNWGSFKKEPLDAG